MLVASIALLGVGVWLACAAHRRGETGARAVALIIAASQARMLVALVLGEDTRALVSVLSALEVLAAGALLTFALVIAARD